MSAGQEKADELEARMIDFGVAMIRLSGEMPKTPAGKHLAGQILRCGTSPAPNYGEARGAESGPDFVHKLGIVLKELNETSVWLRMIQKSSLLPADRLTDIMDESVQLSRIIASSIKTIRSKSTPSK